MADEAFIQTLYTDFLKGENLDSIIEIAANEGYVFLPYACAKAKCRSFTVDDLLLSRNLSIWHTLTAAYNAGQVVSPTWFSYDEQNDYFRFSEADFVSAFINHYSIEKKNDLYMMNGEAASEDDIRSAMLSALSIVRSKPGQSIYSAMTAFKITIAQEAPPKVEDAPQESSEELFDRFFDTIQTERFKPIPTGIEELDSLLGGGILRHSLLILSAAPGTGKTTVAQQIFEAMAAHGTDVIFLNLEMSREQLLARSLSRIIHKQGRNMTAAQVLKGYAWTEFQKQYVTAAAKEYRDTIAPRMQYNPERCSTNLESIRSTLSAAGQKARAAGKPGPVCVLDYLHLVTTEKREEQAEILKKSVAMLKEYAREYDTFVFAISASNRDSNKKGKQALDSARDSSAIEYTADYQLGLNYRAFTEHLTRPNGERYSPDDPDDLDELQNQTPRQMTIQVLKNRMNASGGKIFLDFDAANSVFTFAGRPDKRKRTLSAMVNEAASGMTRIDDDPDNPYL